MRGSLASILVCAIGMGCGEGETDGVSIKCGVGTLINANENGCEPNLADGVSLNSDGQLVPASVGDGGGVRCGDGTILNADGTACVPKLGTSAEVSATGTIEASQAALDAARAEGQGLVTRRECGPGTAINGPGTACAPNLSGDVEISDSGAIVPTAAALAAAQETGRLAGVASVTPLSCADGTLENNDGTMCVANLGADVEVSADTTIVPTAAALAAARAEGVSSVTPLMCGEGTVSNTDGDACVGCIVNEDCSDTETCTDSRCVGLCD